MLNLNYATISMYVWVLYPAALLIQYSGSENKSLVLFKDKTLLSFWTFMIESYMNLTICCALQSFVLAKDYKYFSFSDLTIGDYLQLIYYLVLSTVVIILPCIVYRRFIHFESDSSGEKEIQ